ncbi:MAG: hypothetical protein KGD63_13235 [Candidatus Lokiarchaeota archaeon]|nr:hypothetical protein [Candidatus Lokiarchaeota archaeon]
MIEMSLQRDILIIKVEEIPSNMDKLHLDLMLKRELSGSAQKPIHATISKINNDVFVKYAYNDFKGKKDNNWIKFNIFLLCLLLSF